MRILHVIGRMDRGGTESMLMNHYRYMDHSRIQFDFVVHTKEHCDFDDEIKRLGGNIYHVRRFNVLNIYSYRKDWVNLFREHQGYDAIHVHHFLVAGIILPIAAQYGIPVRIVHSHNTQPPILLMKEKVMWLFHRNMIKYSTIRLACSKAAGRYLFCDEPFMVFCNAIDTEKFRFDSKERERLRCEFGYKPENLVIGHIGSFRTRQKNHAFIVDVFATIIKQNPNARLLLVGVGKLRKEIERKIQSLKLEEKCIFAGARGDVPALLSAMDVFLFPSLFEGLSVVSVEVQASGLPCVASTAITEESRLTDLFVQLRLEEPIEQWAHAVLSARSSKARALYSEEVARAGYDVRANVKRLEDIYKTNYNSI